MDCVRDPVNDRSWSKTSATYAADRHRFAAKVAECDKVTSSDNPSARRSDFGAANAKIVTDIFSCMDRRRRRILEKAAHARARRGAKERAKVASLG